MKKRVFLATGAGGFLGRNFVPLLAKKYPKDLIIAVARRKPGGFARVPHIRWVLGDLREARVWRKIPSGVTHVFHLAARIPYAARDRNDASVLSDNTQPVLHLIETAQRWRRLEQIIYSSSISVYGPSAGWKSEEDSLSPAGVYGFAKYFGEKMLSAINGKKVRVAILRFSSLYGPGQYPGTVLPRMMLDARDKGKILVFGRGARTQDFLHVRDAARALLLAAARRAHGVFNVGFGRPVRMLQLARIIGRIGNGKDVRVRLVPERTEGDAGNKINTLRAKTGLGFRPTITLEQGLRGCMAGEGLRA